MMRWIRSHRRGMNRGLMISCPEGPEYWYNVLTKVYYSLCNVMRPTRFAVNNADIDTSLQSGTIFDQLVSDLRSFVLTIHQTSLAVIDLCTRTAFCVACNFHLFLLLSINWLLQTSRGMSWYGYIATSDVVTSLLQNNQYWRMQVSK